MRVVGIDYPCVDLLVRIDKVPPVNSYGNLLEYSWQGGGKVSSAFAALGRLGVASGIIGAVGDDEFGRFIRDDFKRYQVDTTHLITKANTGSYLSFVISDSESRGRRIIGNFDGRLEIITPAFIQEIKDYLTSAEYLHIARMCPAEKTAAVIMKNAGKKVLIDADSYSQEIIENIGLVDVFIGSEEFYNSMFSKDSDMESNLKSVLSMGPETVVFTFGIKGCVVCCKAGIKTIPTFIDMPVVDTVGAGDVFHGAFLAALLRGKDPFESALFGNAVSSVKITRIGGRAGIPTYDMTEEFLRTGEFHGKELDNRVSFYQTALFQKEI